LQKAYNALDVQLFIMQFGGNVMPYIKDTAAAVNYGKWFYSQLTTLKSLRPNASLIVIGPSDMSYKEGENYVTYPYLEVVRDELRKATFKAGFAYWDMYEAMGGHNSMPSWVRSEPALAGSDYTHFTPRGAKLIANMFYNALMIESIKK
jgi:lysophospholipase L1-like esterase